MKLKRVEKETINISKKRRVILVLGISFGLGVVLNGCAKKIAEPAFLAGGMIGSASAANKKGKD